MSELDKKRLWKLINLYANAQAVQVFTNDNYNEIIAVHTELSEFIDSLIESKGLKSES